MRHFFTCLLLGSLLLIISCQDDFETGYKRDASDFIKFKVILPVDDISKGILINSTSSEDFNNFGLFAYSSSQEFSYTEVPSEFYLNNEFKNKIVQKNNSGNWGFNTNYYWPQNQNISFFAYFPYIDTTSVSNGLKINYIENELPSISYTMPSNAINQPDLMIAVPEVNLYREVAELKFAHALASIGFEITGPSVGIDSIWITGISTSGTVSLKYDNQSIVWTDLNTPNKDPFVVGLINDPIATKDTASIMSQNGYLMVIPQTLPDSAYIMIKFDSMDVKKILLKNTLITEWEAGNKYTYLLKEGDYNFIVTADTSSCNFYGGTFNLSITSTYTPVEGTKTPIDLGWTVSLASADTNQVYGYNTLDGMGGTNIKRQISLGLSPYTYSQANEFDQTLQNNATYSYSDINDLSVIKDSVYSSNSYMVSNSGWHKFPAFVMGNGINGSTTNNITINNKNCFPDSIPYFVNYAGQTIENISDLEIPISDGCSAELLWMDAPELIDSVELRSDKYIQFFINNKTIRQGNALIALKNSSGTIMWSWHIWVTPWELILNSTTSLTDIFFFNINIGECLASTYIYEKREFKLIFTQNESNLTKEILLTQLYDSIFVDYNSLYFQWGRKDPMLGSVGYSVPKTCFGNTPFETSTSTTMVTIEDGIKNPNIFYCAPKSWYSEDIKTLWFLKSGFGVKTIYDPSPIFFRVPQRKALSKLEVNKGWETANNFGAFNFKYSNGDESETLNLTLIANGYRNGSDGRIMNNNNFGYYWSSVDLIPADSTYKASSLFFNNLIVDEVINNAVKSMGYTICPMQDQFSSDEVIE